MSRHFWLSLPTWGTFLNYFLQSNSYLSILTACLPADNAPAHREIHTVSKSSIREKLDTHLAPSKHINKHISLAGSRRRNRESSVWMFLHHPSEIQLIFIFLSRLHLLYLVSFLWIFGPSHHYALRRCLFSALKVRSSIMLWGQVFTKAVASGVWDADRVIQEKTVFPHISRPALCKYNKGENGPKHPWEKFPHPIPHINSWICMFTPQRQKHLLDFWIWCWCIVLYYITYVGSTHCTRADRHISLDKCVINPNSAMCIY